MPLLNHILRNRITISHSILSLNHHFLLIPLATMTSAAASAVDDAKHGFSRPEMYKDNLAGTVDAYDRHVFLCYKNHLAWPPRVEASDADPLPKSVATAFRARKNDIAVKTKITVCEAREEVGFSDGDVLIFPEMIKYRGLEESNVDSFFDDVMVSGKAWSGGGVHDVLTGSHIFVCAHGSRDVRCGVCGPVLMQKLNDEIELRGLKDQISVVACSHIGGHKYAGNLIVYSPGPDGKIMGHWYGYVTPNDVPALLDQHIAKGEVIQKLWRGQMGPPIAGVNGTDDKKLANGNDTGKAKKNDVESNNLSNNENVVGCCQGVNGVSCCRSTSFEQNKEIGETTEAHKKQGSKISWNWPVLQEREILTTAGILGALAAVAVGYGFYRRSG
ncbi:altered inheritance of mitochondria protein 32-like [Gastrolobium bilobum]|uniref:altered inheritance of mitochondria protein 32-like n=1 Tax=Gastrolobium bilobum TaxID=150636 RepID=UPI002AB01D8E|nr:altered inheritance of mitochondria protein 32-like [Gastrolobium bilobum]